MKQVDQPWSKQSGPWGVTRHAIERMAERFQFTDADILEVRECLANEHFVRVPENDPRKGRYVIQMVVTKGALFLIVALDSKIIVSVRPPFCSFPGEIPGKNAPVVNWSDDDEGVPADDVVYPEPKVKKGKALPAGVTLIQVPMYKSAVGRLCNTAEEAAEVNVHYQVMKLVEDIADEERDSDEKYLDKDDVVEYMMAGADRLVRIFSGEAVFPWPKDAK
jgi:hypothetical protein